MSHNKRQHHPSFDSPILPAQGGGTLRAQPLLRGEAILSALNAAAELISQAAASEATILQAVTDQLDRLGLYGGLSLLDETGHRLTVRAVALPAPLPPALEKLAGLPTTGHAFDAAQVDAYWQALETGQAVFVADSGAILAQLLPSSAHRFLEPITLRLGRAPAIIAPLITEGQRLGALSAIGPQLAAAEAPAIMALANHTALALSNARRRVREAQTLRHLRAFNAIALALNNSLAIEDALRLTLRETLAALDLPTGWISLRESEGFWLAAYHNLPPALAADDYAVMRRQPCNCQRKLLAGELPAAVNMLECERLLKWAVGDKGDLSVHASIPIRSGDQILGILNLALPPGRALLDEDELTMLSMVGHQLGVTLARARLHVETMEALRREQRLSKIAHLISSTLDEPTLLQTITRLAAELIGAEAGALALVSEDGHLITFPYLHNLPEGLALEPTPKGQGLAWHIVEVGETTLLNDYAAHPKAWPQGVAAGVRAFVGAPIVAGETRLGVLALFGLNPAVRFTERDAALAETVGRQAGVAIQNARLFKAKQWQVEALTALRQVALDLSAQLDLPTLLHTITDRAARLLRAALGGLYLMLPDGETLELAVSYHLPRDYTGARLRLGEGLAGRIAQTGEPFIVDDYRVWEGRASVYAGVPFAAVVGAPIKWQGKVIGVITVADVQPGRFGPAEAEMLTRVADQAAVAIVNARLYEKLEGREAYFRALIENAWDGVMILDSRGGFRYASPSIKRILGYWPADLIGRSIFGLIHPDDASQVAQALQEVMTSDFVPLVEARLRHRDGSWRWLEATERNLLKNPHVAGVLVNFHDITERKRAEAALQQQFERAHSLYQLTAFLSQITAVEEVYQAALDSLQRTLAADRASILLFDPDGVMRFKAWRGLSEAYRKTVQGHSPWPPEAQDPQPILVADAQAEPSLASLRRTFAEEGIGALGFIPLVHQGRLLGKFMIYYNTPHAFSAAEVQLAQTIARHVAFAVARRQAEEALAASEARYRSFYENVHDVIYRTDYHGVITDISPSLEKRFGYRREEVVGRFVQEFYCDLQDYAALLATLERDGAINDFEIRLKRRDGRPVPVSITSRIVFDAQGQPIATEGVLRDITERKRAEAALRRRTTELETLEQVAAALRTASNRAEMLPVILDQVLTLLNADGAALATHNPATKETVIELARGGWAAWSGLRLAPGEGVTGYVIANGRPYVNEDVSTDPRIAPPELIRGLHAVACLPLIAHQQILGALWAGRAPGRRPDTGLLAPRSGFSEAEVHLLTAIADITANALRRETLREQNERNVVELARAYVATLEGWSRALELRDKETEGHTQRVAEMTLELARALGISDEEELSHLRWGALLHDIGKMGVPDDILLKPGPLTEEEWVIMRRHPQYAYDMLSPIAYLHPALDIPHYHHEKWDGTGYPCGLKGKEIPLAARIFAVVDVWDALRHDRPYRPAWPEEKARAYLRQQAGKHFDPEVAEVFLKMIEK